jgi:hypothetical protein
MTMLIASNFDEASGNVLNYGSAGDWSLAGSTCTRVAGGHTSKGLQDGGNNEAKPPNVGQTNNRTFMFWLKGPLPSLDWVFEFYNAAGDTGQWGLLVQSGLLRVRGRNTSDTVVPADITIPSDINTVYHHIAGTFDGSNIRAYLDGTLISTAALSGTLKTDGVLQLMGYSVSTIIDDLRVYDEVLDQSTISTLMNTPVGVSAVPEALAWNGSAWVSSSMRYWNGSAWSAS